MKFTRIDELYRSEYFFLRVDDECYFLREYTAGRGFAGSETNDIVHNVKKSPARKGKSDWPYKERAIHRVAEEMRAGLAPAWLKRATLVPMPPSRARSDPEYDDRMLRILRLLGEGLDVRELISCRTSTFPSHRSERRPKPDELRANYDIDEELCHPPPKVVGLVDDVLTAGAHFRAAKDLLVARFPGVSVVGVFYARTIRLVDDDEP